MTTDQNIPPGAQFYDEYLYYKFGAHNHFYVWQNNAWIKTSKSLANLSQDLINLNNALTISKELQAFHISTAILNGQKARIVGIKFGITETKAYEILFAFCKTSNPILYAKRHRDQTVALNWLRKRKDDFIDHTFTSKQKVRIKQQEQKRIIKDKKARAKNRTKHYARAMRTHSIF